MTSILKNFRIKSKKAQQRFNNGMDKPPEKLVRTGALEHGKQLLIKHIKDGKIK